VLRNRGLRGRLRSSEAAAAILDLVALPIERYPHRLLLERAFALRDNATIYNALYLALAEFLEATLLTRDKALARGRRSSGRGDRRLLNVIAASTSCPADLLRAHPPSAEHAGRDQPVDLGRAEAGAGQDLTIVLAERGRRAAQQARRRREARDHVVHRQRAHGRVG